MIKIENLQMLQVGVQGEFNSRAVQLDMSKWVQELTEIHPELHLGFDVLFRAYDTTTAYPMPSEYDADTKILTWVIPAAATQVSGVGYTEVRALGFSVDDDSESNPLMLRKTPAIPTSVENSLTGDVGSETPEPEADWVTQVLYYKNAAEYAQTAAETAQTAAETAKTAAETAQTSASAASTQAIAAKNAAVAAATTVTSEAVEAGKQRAYAEIAGTKDTASYMEDETMEIYVNAPLTNVTDSAGVSHFIRDHAKGWAGESKREAEYAASRAAAAAESATAAAASATDAAQAATSAASSATGLETAVATAQAAAASASGSASNAAGSASTATLKALQASQAETNAAISASAAHSFSETASTQAGEAESSATSASESASAAAASATAAEAAADMAEEYQQAIESIEVLAQTNPEGSPATVSKTYDQDDHLVAITFGIPKGDTGDPGDVIDDTAGEGDTGKTWSADKLSGIEEDINDLDDSVSSLSSAINQLPTEETGQDLLDEETKNSGLTETALEVIGLLFDRMPHDESAMDIYYSIVLENERLLAIYDIWESERSA